MDENKLDYHQPYLEFTKNGKGFLGETSKGSKIIIYNKDNRYDWFIKGPKDTYKSPEKNTQQQQEEADTVSLIGWEDPCDAISNCITTINEVYNVNVKWRIK